MKDRVFTGTDVPDALALAAASLGLPETDLRYVVLDAGSEGVDPGQAGLRPGRTFIHNRDGGDTGGTGGRARTDTPLRERDFESRASTNSATPAHL